MTNAPRPVVVVGAGQSGLAAARASSNTLRGVSRDAEYVVAPLAAYARGATALVST